MNPAPILRAKGRVHSVSLDTIPAFAGRPEQRDPETNRLVSRAVDPRAEYELLTVVILTEGGGFCSVKVLPDALEKAGGEVPNRDQVVDWPVRPYVEWAGPEGRRYTRPAYSLAGDVAASEQVAGGSRRSEPAPV